jgi:AGZA family xanthine/uracil permease-like MFS transporter
MGFLERTFKIGERGSSVGQEVLGGVTTFMALSYIIFVQPAVMAVAGVPKGGALVATCVASGIACLLMGILANYPIALAPAMGHNFYFTFTVCLGLGFSWQQGLTAVFVGGCIFVLLSFVGFRAKVMEVIPDGLKRAIAGGIGLLIALIGLEYAGIIMGSAGTFVRFGDIQNKYTLLALFGLLVTLVLLALNVRGAVLFGIVLTTLFGLLLRQFGIEVLTFELQPWETLRPAESLFKLDFGGLFTAKGFIAVILTFLFLDVFDTVGTLIGVSETAGLLDEQGRLPRARWALFSDASGTVVGSLMGTSTITSYIESAAGVQAGARTGLANVTTAILFFASVLLYPVLGIVASEHEYVSQGFTSHLYPVLAPALIVVGSMMLKSLARLLRSSSCLWRSASPRGLRSDSSPTPC